MPSRWRAEAQWEKREIREPPLRLGSKSEKALVLSSVTIEYGLGHNENRALTKPGNHRVERRTIRERPEILLVFITTVAVSKFA